MENRDSASGANATSAAAPSDKLHSVSVRTWCRGMHGSRAESKADGGKHSDVRSSTSCAHRRFGSVYSVSVCKFVKCSDLVRNMDTHELPAANDSCSSECCAACRTRANEASNVDRVDETAV